MATNKVEITTVEDAVLKEMTAAVKIVMVQRGLKKNSDVVNSAEVIWSEQKNAFVMLANSYFEYASSGRRRMVRKVPIKDLLEWSRQYGIRPRAHQTLNQMLFAIQEGIYKNGIKKKGYATPVEEVLTDISAEATAEILSEVIAEVIAESIDNT